MATRKPSTGFTAEEKAAMREYAQERKGGAKNDESALLAQIAKMPPADRALAEKLDALVRKHAPSLTARTWYGMPAYAKDDKVVLYFQSAAKFKSRYATLGFSDKAQLDAGEMWPVVFALLRWNAAVEAQILKLLKAAAG